ncbi:MAG: ISNCY family transposase, partial [Bacteroidetes bacterium]|nr:ISNCY family transposase [Bacteroidota bacterium]
MADIEIDPKDRDDIPAVLMGLQALYVDAETRAKIFEILERHVRPEVSHRHGRPGMDLWRIFVLAVVKMALNCDFDRL